VEQAYSLYNQGRMLEAIDVMKEVASVEPDSGKYYFIGYAYYKLQDFKSARKYFNKAYEVNPNYDVMKGDEDKDPMK
jgi:Flp pilus assembly protein TadD